ncbi:MAG: hypothetical protein CBD77_03425 [bacterium TMED217]|nr:MAG: hypothetical protein CBD77_03425 [bacterium TMED217]|tara:strand:+ start:27368 stop:28039 length:672 start_codon:yes stop_codon:yes gene_type:complete
MKNINLIKTDFSIQTFKGGFDKNFSYLVTCMRTGSEIIIDASLKLDRLKPFIKTNPIMILITHTHRDHIEYISNYVNAFPSIKIIGHPDSESIFDNNFMPASNNTTIKVGSLKIQSIHTPGHYFDSICYLIENVIFTGDTLFVGRTGRTVSNKSDITELYKSVYKKLLELPKDTYIYPGHDYGLKPSITIRENIKISELLQAKDESDFIKKMTNYEDTRKVGS